MVLGRVARADGAGDLPQRRPQAPRPFRRTKLLRNYLIHKQQFGGKTGGQFDLPLTALRPR